MSTQKLDFSGLSLEMLQLCFVAERAAPKEKVVELVDEKEQETLDEFEIRRRQFFQP
jgi:hypothetical protein